jgi:hypothetical protein
MRLNITCLFYRCLLAAGLTVSALSASAQLAASDPDWKETDAPPPPVLNLNALVYFDMPGSTLKWGLDEKSIIINPDGIIRYVVVAQSASGTVNAFYEGTRCATGQVKTYARHTPGVGWTPAVNLDWKSIFEPSPSQHTRRLARQGLCDGAAPPNSVRELVRRVRTGTGN